MFFDVETLAGVTDDFVGSSADLDANSGNGPAAQATLFGPFGITVTPSGAVYVTEPFFNGIRKIENGVVSTLASRTQGSTDGPLSEALFRGPTGIASDQAGNLYIADQNNHRIRKIDTSGNVTTVAGPSGSERLAGWVDDLPNQSLFSRPRAVAVDAAGRSLYVSEHDRIRNRSAQLVRTRSHQHRGPHDRSSWDEGLCRRSPAACAI
jgi:DNA-binding beta-propeller fold protein YncE